MNTLHSTIEDSRINVARHEFGHALLAHELGFQVDGIDLQEHPDRYAGCTLITYPVTPATFAEAYEHSPLEAGVWLVGILAVVRAGCYCEIHGGQIGGEPYGHDLQRIEEWRTAALGHYGPDGWVQAYAEAFRGLRTWYSSPQLRVAFREAAACIAPQAHIGRYQLHSIFQASGALSCPPPRFEVVMPVRRQPAPAPVPAFTASVRRPPAVASVPQRPAETRLLLPRPIPTTDTDDYIVNYLGDHDGAQLLSLMHRRSKALAWAVVGNRESWDFGDYAKAVAKFEALDPGRRVVRR
jgi:hypothetical protein